MASWQEHTLSVKLAEAQCLSLHSNLLSFAIKIVIILIRFNFIYEICRLLAKSLIY